MKLKNSALQELYDTLVSAGVSMSPYADSPVYEAFRECDDELSESITFATIKDLQDRNDILERSNSTLRKLNTKMLSKTRKFEKEIEELQKDRDGYFDLYTKLRKDYDKLFEENRRLKIPGSIDYERVMRECDDLKKALQDAKTTLVKANADRTNLQEACDKLSGDNRRLNARIDCLREEVIWYRKHYKEQSDKILGLKSRPNSMCGNEYLNKLLDSTRSIGYENGQINLWNMLQNVNDAKPFELATCFPDVTCVDDILSWDLEDFLDAYNNWQERVKKIHDQKETDHMRKWLADFCYGRVCDGCPLESNEYKCGLGYSFARHDLVDNRIIPDEDIKRYYEKARACSKPTCHRDTWTCTLEGTIEIDKNLLNKVCGIDSDD